MKTSFSFYLNKFDNLKLIYVLPLLYFFTSLFNVVNHVPYYWYGEITMIFFIVILFFYAEVNKALSTTFSVKNEVNVLSESVCINIIIFFLINTFWIITLRFFNENVIFDYNVALDTETSYLGSSALGDACRLFVSFLFIVNMINSISYTKLRKDIIFEFYGLMGLLGAFVLLCIDCKNLFLFFLLVEAISFLLVGLICFARTKTSFEIALKFFILSGVFTLIGLLGCVIVYASLHTLDYRVIKIICSSFVSNGIVFSSSYIAFLNFGVVLIYVAILFKLGSFPFHVYVADYSSECFYPLLFFFLVPLKVMFFFVLSVLFMSFSHAESMSSTIFLFCGLTSIVVGAKSAVCELEIKKFLAFSSINQFGFALLALTVPTYAALVAAYIFIIVYCISMILFLYVPMQSFNKNNREAFLFLNHFAYYGYFDTRRWSSKYLLASSTYKDFNSTEDVAASRERFGPQFRFLVVLFSLIGIPPLPGFGAKFLIFFVLMLYQHIVVVVFALLISLVSAYYYLNLIYKMFNKSESSSFILSENYFKFFKRPYLESFQLLLGLVFFWLSFTILDMSIFFSLSDLLYYLSF